MNETLKTIEKRYSCRNFKDLSLKDAETNLIIKAALQSPSGMNRQNWHVVVVKNKDLISELEEEGMDVLKSFEDKSLYERILKRGGKLFYNAPCLILIAIKESNPKGAELIDLGIIAQNVVLAATSLDIASCHCGFACFAFATSKKEEFKKKLNFPSGYECGIGILLGYPEDKGKAHDINFDKVSIIE